MAAPAVGSSASTKVLRVLALHGYWQNEHSFRERTGALRKNLKNRAELVMISAPLTIPEPDPEKGDGQREDPRGWWFSDPEKNSFNALEETQSCAGLEESLDAVAKAFSELGPFDGILGFSQGAAFAAMLCALKQQGDLRFQFDFAILVAGFKSRASDHTRFYKDPITVPSLHVFGDTDRVIPGDLSQELAAHFVNPVLLTHSGGHYIPVCAAQKKVYFPFLDSFRR
ncbi:esterase OVCA2 isoform X2 [Bufo gargarizans]|uniref:esterase OVCA2 isoform X2 n=1 Tax=Bufo gargarizans TaxID=30331 RepID=UPI001CF3C4C2|nr:esterase OVCA2 isoform X2 [Bufo gargarizans]